ncbi:TOX high mobility group box family member 3-like isoform X2 [Acanthaster planci]|uniref:TOX high mobility group box family member 3-like isoform X2 n=1 Tax=Acanthaster planci TaxID=133434 RepID=A0A8B7XHM0_ACAPL|nr:TOX high mobility group box family member 3-like isoform X2 [Acanthaster planci]
MEGVFCLETDFEPGAFDQYLYKGQTPAVSFVNGFNFGNSSGVHHNNNFVAGTTMSSQTFHTPSFGDDEFDIPPISQGIGESNITTMTDHAFTAQPVSEPVGSQALPPYHTDSMHDRRVMSSPSSLNNQTPPPLPPQQQHQQQMLTSPVNHANPPMSCSPSMSQSLSQAMTLPSPTHGHTMTDPANHFPSAISNAAFTEPLSHMTESLPNPATTSMPVNPQFPPHNLDIPPITESTGSLGTMSDMLQPSHSTSFSHAGPTTTQIYSPSYHMPHVSHGMDMFPMDSHSGQHLGPLSTINQSAISSQLGMHGGLQPGQGMMGSHPTLGKNLGPGNTRSPHQESSEDSDDNTPLAQFAAKRPESKETKKKPPKRKRKKDPNEPQKPVSAYALFFRDTQAAIKGQNPNASFGEVSKIVASMWDSLGTEQKQAYKQRTETAKKEYLKKLAAYRASLVSKAAVDTTQSEEQSPSKQKKTSAAPVSTAAPPTQAGHAHIAPRVIAPKPVVTGVPITVTMTTAGKPMMQPGLNPMQAAQRVVKAHPMMGIDGMPPHSHQICTRNGCNKPSIESPDWDNEYCSNECVVDHCRLPKYRHEWTPYALTGPRYTDGRVYPHPAWVRGQADP